MVLFTYHMKSKTRSPFSFTFLFLFATPAMKKPNEVIYITEIKDQPKYKETSKTIWASLYKTQPTETHIIAFPILSITKRSREVPKNLVIRVNAFAPKLGLPFKQCLFCWVV